MLGLSAGCGDQPLEARAELATLARMDIVSGDRQAALVGTQLPAPLIVRVIGRDGQPVEKQVVNFRVTAGGGSVFAGVALTDENGQAQEWWTLGNEPGENRLEARAVDPASGEKFVLAQFVATGVVDKEPPIRPASSRLELALVGDDSVRVRAHWTSVEDAVSYDWTAGTNSGRWSARGSVKDSVVTTRAPFRDEEYWLCVRAVDAAGNRSAEPKCATADAPAKASPQEPQQPEPEEPAPEDPAPEEPGPEEPGPEEPADTAGLPARPTTPKVTLASVNADTFSIQATWGAVQEAVSYKWSTGTNSGRWQKAGSTEAAQLTVKAPVRDETYWFCVASVNAAGRSSAEQSCNTFTPPEAEDPEEPEYPTPAIGSVEVSPASAELEVGETLQLTAVVRDGAGQELPDQTVTWSSSNAAVATVTNTGRVTAVGSGSATITAAAGGISDRVTVAVIEPPSTQDPPPDPSDSSPAFVEDFELYADGADVTGGNSFFRWTDGRSTSVSSGRAHSGSRSLEFRYGPYEGGYRWAEQRFAHDPVQEYWLEYYVYIPENYFHHRVDNANNNKFFAWWGPNGYSAPGMGTFQLWAIGDTGDSYINMNRYGPNSTYAEYTGRNANIFDASHHGTWQRIRIHLKLSDMGQRNGIQKLWRGDELLLNDINDNNSADRAEANVLTAGYFWGWDNGRYTEPTVFYVDDIKIYTSDPGW
ncbi:MAG TPA: Ig-like domain-containing protein [Longimicrobiaceae bacterium]